MSAADDEALLSAQSLLDGEELRINPRKPMRFARTLLIAAVLAAILGATAFAAGWLTPNPVVMEGSVVYRVEQQADGSVLYMPDEEARHISLTRFQMIPEHLDPAIRAKAENNLAAWEEWCACCLQADEMPRSVLPPEGCDSMSWEDHADGSATLRYYRSVANGPRPDQRQRVLIESRTLTHAQLEEWNEYLSQNRPDLTALLKQYGLKRRGPIRSDRQMLGPERFQRTAEQNGLHFDADSFSSDGRCFSSEEIAARAEALFCHAPLFTSLPAGFERVYWFDSGDFCLSYALELSDAARADCYAYIGRYDVFHTGNEIYAEIPNYSDGSSGSLIAADGTMLSVLLFGENAVLYAFLPDAYFCEHVHCDRALTQSDLQQIADFLNCSAIGVD